MKSTAATFRYRSELYAASKWSICTRDKFFINTWSWHQPSGQFRYPMTGNGGKPELTPGRHQQGEFCPQTQMNFSRKSGKQWSKWKNKDSSINGYILRGQTSKKWMPINKEERISKESNQIRAH